MGWAVNGQGVCPSDLQGPFAEQHCKIEYVINIIDIFYNSEIMVEITIEKIISFVAGYAYLECLESGKNFQDFFQKLLFYF